MPDRHTDPAVPADAEGTDLLGRPVLPVMEGQLDLLEFAETET